MSRVKIYDLFDIARKLKTESRRIDMEWIKTQRACVKELRRIEAEDVRVNAHLADVLRRLAAAGFSEREIAAGRPKRKKGKKS